MASKLLGSQTLRTTRSYASAAAKTAPTAEASQQVKTTTLNNGLVVTSVESSSPLSRVAVAFRVGSRNEPAGKEGLVHVLRMASVLSTKETSQFALTRTLNQAGASLECASGREHVIYSLNCTRQHIGGLLPKLSDVATQQAFKPWELNDNMYRIKLDLASVQPQAKAIDLLHKVGFRHGLGNSIFCPSHMVGKHSSEDLKQFVSTNFITKNAAVIGVGVPHEQLVDYAQKLSLLSGSSGPSAASKVHGGDVRVELGGNTAHVALATAGGSLSDLKNALVFALLQRVLGSAGSVKYGNSSASKLLSVDPSLVAVSALNLNYSDAGLFGLTISAPANMTKDAVLKAAKLLRSLKISDAQLASAKAQLKADLLMGLDNSAQALENLTLGTLFNGSSTDVFAVLSQIEKITSADVNAVAGQLTSAKFAVAAVGNVQHVPYADEL